MRVAPVVNVGASSSSPAGAGAAELMRRATLAGISPQAPAKQAARSTSAPDDLDWELPPSVQAAADALEVTLEKEPSPESLSQTQPLPRKAPAPAPATEPEEPMHVDVEELPPESKPSGIGQTYKPRDADAPPVVLTEEVQRTEAQARAMLEAQHRARSAPTIARMPAVRVAPSSPTAADPADFEMLAPRKSRAGLWVALVVAILALGGGAFAFLAKPKATTPEAKVAAEPPPVVADTRAPPPPELPPPVVTPPPEQAAPAPAESAAAAEPPAAPPEQKPAEPPPTEAEQPAPKRPEPVAARTLKPKPTAPKPPASPKPAAAPKPAGGKPSGVIVRDNPF